jgi:hypothetical protein
MYIVTTVTCLLIVIKISGNTFYRKKLELTNLNSNVGIVENVL